MKGAIFDLDGTLIDSMCYWATIGEKYLKSKNIEIDEETKKACEVLPISRSSAFIKKRYNLTEAPEEVAAGLYDIVENNYKNDIPLKEGVLEFIKKLHNEDIKMCIATATDRFMAEYAVKRLDILKYFEFIITCAEVNSTKAESPLIYEEAMKKLGTKKEETVIFEDAPHAVSTAKKADFYVVGVYDDYFKGKKDDIIKTADKFICSFDELKHCF